MSDMPDVRGGERPLRLSEQWLPLAYKVAQDMGRRFQVPYTELYGEAAKSAVYAESMYDPAKGVPFKYYMCMCVRHRLTFACKRWWQRRRAVTLLPTCEPPDDEGRHNVIDNACARPEGDPLAKEQVLELMQRVDMPEKWWKVLWLRCAEGRTYEEISLTFGCSKQWIQQLVGKAMRRIRDAYAGSEEAG